MKEVVKQKRRDAALRRLQALIFVDRYGIATFDSSFLCPFVTINLWFRVSFFLWFSCSKKRVSFLLFGPSLSILNISSFSLLFSK